MGLNMRICLILNICNKVNDVEISWPNFPLINLLADGKGQTKRILLLRKGNESDRDMHNCL